MFTIVRRVALAVASVAVLISVAAGQAGADDLSDQCARVTDLRFLPAFCQDGGTVSYEGTTNQPEAEPVVNDGNLEAPAPRHVYLGEVVEVLDENGDPVLNEQGAPTYEYVGRWEEIAPSVNDAQILSNP